MGEHEEAEYRKDAATDTPLNADSNELDNT
jgi:hypothetical protein